MEIKINVKGVSNRENKIRKLVYEYPDEPMTLRVFLEKTVERTLEDYNSGKTVDDVIKNICRRDLEDMAATGKVAYNVHYNEKRVTLSEAVANALLCFEDGMVAVIVDGTRREKLDEAVNLKEGSEVTFVRLTFLAGRMW